MRDGHFNPIFLLGGPRSGTTWLNFILAEHPDISTGPETFAFEIIDSIFSAAESRLLAGQGILADGYMDRTDLCQICAELFHSLVESQIDGAKHYVEKTPLHTRYIDRIHEIFPDSRIVHLVRDGRDVVCSMIAARAERNFRFPASVKECAARWRQIDRVLQFGEQHGGLYHELRYEDLVNDVRNELARLLAVLNIAAPREVLDRMHHASAEIHRPSSRSSTHGFVGKWRQSFTREDAATFRAVAGDLLIRLGYELDDRW